MSIPAEISALVRAATNTIKAWQALAALEADAPAVERRKVQKALDKALDAQGRALEKVAVLARRPRQSIDIDGVVRSVLDGFKFVEGAAKITKAVSEAGGPPSVIEAKVIEE